MRLRRLNVGPLRERNFRLLAAARTISFFGTNLVAARVEPEAAPAAASTA